MRHMKWKLKVSSKIRGCIGECNSEETLNEILNILSKVSKKIKDDEFDDDLLDLKNMTEVDLSILKDGDDLDKYNYEDEDDMIDCRLYDFWNFCDKWKIWIEI